MQIILDDVLKETAMGEEADNIVRNCVHCGFCIATCPTYQLSGDDLDSPRGRIYLIKSMLEGKDVSKETQVHLDRCLECLACETICPSGVRYGRLLDIGRNLVNKKVKRSPSTRIYRYSLRSLLPYRNRFKFILRLGQFIRPILPRLLRNKVPSHEKSARCNNLKTHDRKVILFSGCVQDTLSPGINEAAKRLLDLTGTSTVTIKDEACCGALNYHMGDEITAINFMCRNIDQWWPYVESGIEAIVITASGCGVTIKDYGSLLKDVPDYAEKAKQISALASDISELFKAMEIKTLESRINDSDLKVAYQSPCTLQHGQRLPGKTESLLKALGFNLVESSHSETCCGSAGTYSLLEPKLAKQLQGNKIAALKQNNPDVIATSNIGCLHHLQQVSDVPVKHWVEIVNALIP